MTRKTSTICSHTETRREACACGACTKGKTAEAKHGANRRDALALLRFIESCIEHGPGERPDCVHWGHVGSAANVREKLMELAVGFTIGPDGCEQAARHRLEDALCAADEDVGNALIDAI